MDRRNNRPHEEHTELQRMGALVKSIFYVVGMTVLAPLALNKISKAIDSDLVFSFDFYKIAKVGF